MPICIAVNLKFHVGVTLRYVIYTHNNIMGPLFFKLVDHQLRHNTDEFSHGYDVFSGYIVTDFIDWCSWYMGTTR